MQPPSELLLGLGFNRLESDIYVLLLGEAEPLTAYRIAKKLGKAAANVYKAIDTLSRKGAVLLDRSEPQRCRPVAAEEFLDGLERSHGERIAAARRSLERLSEPAPDERVYQIEEVSQTLERGRAMLARAESMVVVEVFPRVAERMRDAIQAAVDRGVKVFLQIYAPLEVSGAHVTGTFEGEESREHWRSEQFNLVVDGREVLLSILDRSLGSVHQTLWSNSLYLSCLFHAGMMREYFYNEVGLLAEGEPEGSPLRRIVDEHPRFHTIDVPGQRELFERYGMQNTAEVNP